MKWSIFTKKKNSDATVTDDTAEKNENNNIDDWGVADESLQDKNIDDESTRYVDSVSDILNKIRT